MFLFYTSLFRMSDSFIALHFGSFQYQNLAVEVKAENIKVYFWKKKKFFPPVGMILHASAAISLHLLSIFTAAGDHTDAQQSDPAWEKAKPSPKPWTTHTTWKNLCCQNICG